MESHAEVLNSRVTEQNQLHVFLKSFNLAALWESKLEQGVGFRGYYKYSDVQVVTLAWSPVH
jgi:hypothetical protein